MFSDRQIRMMHYLFAQREITKTEQDIWFGPFFYAQMNWLVKQGIVEKTKTNKEGLIRYSLTSFGESLWLDYFMKMPAVKDFIGRI